MRRARQARDQCNRDGKDQLDGASGVFKRGHWKAPIINEDLVRDLHVPLAMRSRLRCKDPRG